MRGYDCSRLERDAARDLTFPHELRGIALGPGDVAPLAAFLRSLDEDYR